MDHFKETEFADLKGLLELLDTVPREGWIFRGERQLVKDGCCKDVDAGMPPEPTNQSTWTDGGGSLDLETSIQRACREARLDRSRLPDIERRLVREFRRKYDGPDRQEVQDDTLYCLSLMQHHGAPTRFLDWTYSPYVAAYFALQQWTEQYQGVVWCLKVDWCYDSAREKLDTRGNRLFKDLIRAHRVRSKTHGEATDKEGPFTELFMANEYDIVYPVNPFHLHRRLNAQQGTFLCPGKVSVPLPDILRGLSGSDQEKSIVKLIWPDPECKREQNILIAQWDDILDRFSRMNISSASLFPDPEGFARSLNYSLRHFDRLAQLRRY